jgi:hypothetical protein
VPNQHADKLNALYRIQTERDDCHDDDLLLFLDPDALIFLNKWDQRLRTYLKTFNVVAISREENIEPLLRDDQKPYPHPCFLATTVKFWKEHKLSWDLDPSQGAECAGVLLKKFLDVILLIRLLTILKGQYTVLILLKGCLIFGI